MARKRNVTLFKLVSSEGTGVYYVAGRNTKKLPQKLKFRKYDKKLRKHVIFEEKKLTS
jgi:large subunit ribosomal protein L33